MSLSIPRKYIYSNRIEWGNEQGQIHRIDGPAVEYLNGAKEWYVHSLSLVGFYPRSSLTLGNARQVDQREIS